MLSRGQFVASRRPSRGLRTPYRGAAMTPEDDQTAPVEYVFGEALGHVRNATAALLSAEDQSSDSLLLGIAGLDLQGQFGDIWPVWIDDDRTAAESSPKPSGSSVG